LIRQNTVKAIAVDVHSGFAMNN